MNVKPHRIIAKIYESKELLFPIIIYKGKLFYPASQIEKITSPQQENKV